MAINSTSNSTPAYSYLQYKNKIGGLVSGMDIDSIMEKIMKAQSAQMERLQQQKQKYEWTRDAYREVNTTLNTFQQSMFDDYSLVSKWNSKTSNVSDSSKVAVTSTSAAAGNLEITAATAATAASTSSQSANYANTITATNILSDSNYGITSSFSGTFSFTVAGGTEKSISYSSSDTVQSIIDKLNSAGVDAHIDSNGKFNIGTKDVLISSTNDSTTFAEHLGFTMSGNTITANTESSKPFATATTASSKSTSLYKLGVGSGSFQIASIGADGKTNIDNAKTISYSATDTIDSIIKKINSSGAGVTALIGDNGDISIKANNMGHDSVSGADIVVLNDNADLFNKMGFNDTNTKTITQNGVTTKVTALAYYYTDTSYGGTVGTPSKLTVNGVTYNGASNDFSIAGYKITVKQNITSSDSPVTVSSNNDVDAAVDKVKAFVETYNGLIKDLNTRVSEKRQTAYQPLTDAQKAEMTTDQITKWEEKAKAGLLKGDSTLNSVLSKMRETLYTYGTRGGKGVQGESLSSIGIATSKTWSDNGKLEINEDKLRTAIEKDPDILSRIFTGDGTKQNPGLASTIRTTAQTAVKTIEQTAGKGTSASETSYSLGKTIKSLDDKIADWKDRLKDIEERYWNQFSAMETAIQKANSQSSVFSQG